MKIFVVSIYMQVKCDFIILAVIEEQGLTPLLDILRKLGGWPVLEGENWKESEFNWKDSVYKFRKMGYSVDYFIDFSIGVDLKNSTTRIIDVRRKQKIKQLYFSTFIVK